MPVYFSSGPTPFRPLRFGGCSTSSPLEPAAKKPTPTTPETHPLAKDVFQRMVKHEPQRFWEPDAPPDSPVSARQLIKHGADPEQLAQNSRYPVLSWAIAENQPTIVHALQKSNRWQPALLNRQDALGSTPLMVAIHRNRLEAAGWVLQQGADLSLKDNLGHDALDWAALYGETALLSHLLGRADVSPEREERLSALAESQREALQAEEAWEARYPSNQLQFFQERDAAWEEALNPTYSGLQGDLSKVVVQIRLEGPDWKLGQAPSDPVWTPEPVFMEAARPFGERFPAAHALVQAGADVNACNGEGVNALTRARRGLTRERGGRSACQLTEAESAEVAANELQGLQFLLAAGADVNAMPQGFDGLPALAKYADAGNVAAVQLLLETPALDLAMQGPIALRVLREEARFPDQIEAPEKRSHLIQLIEQALPAADRPPWKRAKRSVQ